MKITVTCTKEWEEKELRTNEEIFDLCRDDILDFIDNATWEVKRKSVKLKLTEIAARIDAHLKRFEDQEHRLRIGDREWYHSSCEVYGTRLKLHYMTTRELTGFSVKKSDAITYLAWLDAGNVGKHWEVLK